MGDQPLDTTRRTEIGGLPAYVADLPGLPRAALVFRAGQADETLPRRGLTHLVEHLAVGHYAPAEPISAQVDLLATTVLFEPAPAAEVRGRIVDVCARLAAPPLERVNVDRSVVATEERRNRPGVLAELMALWFGAQGPGLAAHDELGLWHVREHEVAAHAAAWFTAGNAVLALSSPIAGLDKLPLPAGHRRRPAAATPLSRSPLPAERARPQEGIGVGAPLDGTASLVVLAALLERRAWSALRLARGLAYHVECRARPIGPRQRFLHVVADVPDEHAELAVRLVIEEIRALAARAFSAEDLETAKADVARRLTAEPLGMLIVLALGEIVHDAIRTPAEALAEIAAVTAEAVAAHAAELRDRMIATVPEGTRSRELFRLDTTTDVVEGTRHRRRDVPRHPQTRDLVVGADGVSEVGADGRGTTVRYDDCVAAVRRGGGALFLIGADDEVVVVDPDDLEKGLAALSRVEAALPDAVFVAAETGSPESEAEGRAHRATMQELKQRVARLLGEARTEDAKAAVAEAMRRHPDDPVVRRLASQLYDSASASTPTPVTWRRG